ncbi:hypothetical protein NS506_02919 [Nocardia seriolae]|uniref:Uncharacterized protein n=1 Tax=Nocardia seriolae TaxID=37332 RepID=A0ABC8AS53_9NOCA|nr:hypothetical protein NS506_02919 [Nocardia seriolae]
MLTAFDERGLALGHMLRPPTSDGDHDSGKRNLGDLLSSPADS